MSTSLYEIALRKFWFLQAVSDFLESRSDSKEEDRVEEEYLLEEVLRERQEVRG